tara:strand:- start:392 stop:637 length:246 start_codon:yes stop_codon:yes gene_type:complete
MPIYNEIFHSYREEAKKIHNAMRLLVKHRYKIIDLENHLIHSGNIDKARSRAVQGQQPQRAKYDRVPKHSRVYLNTHKETK